MFLGVGGITYDFIPAVFGPSDATDSQETSEGQRECSQWFLVSDKAMCEKTTQIPMIRDYQKNIKLYK